MFNFPMHRINIILLLKKALLNLIALYMLTHFSLDFEFFKLIFRHTHLYLNALYQG